MVDLTARAIITAVDRFSGPVRGMAGALSAFQTHAGNVMRDVGTRAVVAQEKLNNAHRAITRMPIMAPSALALGALIERTQEFEKFATGTKIASIPDAFREVADEFGRMHRTIDFAKVREEGEKYREGALDLSRTLGLLPAPTMKAAQAASKMGVSYRQAMALAKEAGIWSMADDEMVPDHGVETLGGWAYQFGAPKDPEGYAAFVRALADKAKTLADRTPTSLRPFAEGIKQVAPLWAQTGGTFDELAAIIGTAAMTKQNEIEIGTATKMAIVRAINPTLLNSASWARAGMKKSQYMNLIPQDPIKATNQIISTYSGYLSKGARGDIRTLLETAIKDGDVLGAVDPIAAMVAEKAGGAFSHDELRIGIANMVTSGGLQFKSWKYLRDTAEQFKKGAISFGDFVQRFSGFHASRMMSFLAHPEWMDELLELSQKTQGLGQEARERIYRESRYGKWIAFKSAIDRLLVNLGGSAPMLAFVEGLEKISEGSLDPIAKLWNFLTTAEMPPNPFAKWAEEGIEVFKQKLGDGSLWESFKKGGMDAIESLKKAWNDKADAPGAQEQREELARLWESQNRVPGSASSSLPPLAKTTDDLIRSLEGWRGTHRDGDFLPGPREPAQVQVQGEARIKVDVDIHGLPQGATAMPRTPGDAKVPLSTGRGMSDTK